MIGVTRKEDSGFSYNGRYKDRDRETTRTIHFSTYLRCSSSPSSPLLTLTLIPVISLSLLSLLVEQLTAIVVDFLLKILRSTGPLVPSPLPLPPPALSVPPALWHHITLNFHNKLFRSSSLRHYHRLTLFIPYPAYDYNPYPPNLVNTFFFNYNCSFYF